MQRHRSAEAEPSEARAVALWTEAERSGAAGRARLRGRAPEAAIRSSAAVRPKCHLTRAADSPEIPLEATCRNSPEMPPDACRNSPEIPLEATCRNSPEI